jgi:hypothetical protein
MYAGTYPFFLDAMLIARKISEFQLESMYGENRKFLNLVNMW